MATSLTSAFSPETLRQHGLTPDEYEKIKQLLGAARAHAHRTRHLQRDVERALLLQIVARASEAPAHAQQARAAGTGRERRHHRHWRRLGLRLQDRIAQSSVVHRAVSGRDHGRRRDSARHLHHGSEAGRGDGFAALRADQARVGTDRRRSHPHKPNFTRIIPSSKAWSAGSLPTATVSECRTWAARRSSSPATREIRW